MTHSEVLIAIAEGKQLQLNHKGSPWYEMHADKILEMMASKMRTGNCDHVFRVKPEPKPDFVRWGNIGRGGYGLFSATQSPDTTVVTTLDGETHALKSVRMLGQPCPKKMEALLRKMADREATQALWDEMQEVLKP